MDGDLDGFIKTAFEPAERIGRISPPYFFETSEERRESGTKFFEMRDRLSLPDDDEVAEMYLKTVKSLAELGFVQ